MVLSMQLHSLVALTAAKDPQVPIRQKRWVLELSEGGDKSPVTDLTVLL
jgi:hypothetical protein